MSGVNVNTVRCEALFVSALQESDSPAPADIHQAIRQAVRELGSRGCAALVAQEFGDHPETAVERMRWARRAIEIADARATGPIHRTQTPLRPAPIAKWVAA